MSRSKIRNKVIYTTTNEVPIDVNTMTYIEMEEAIVVRYLMHSIQVGPFIE